MSLWVYSVQRFSKRTRSHVGAKVLEALSVTPRHPPLADADAATTIVFISMICRATATGHHAQVGLHLACSEILQFFFSVLIYARVCTVVSCHRPFALNRGTLTAIQINPLGELRPPKLDVGSTRAATEEHVRTNLFDDSEVSKLPIEE